MKNSIRFLAVFFTAITLSASMAHLLALKVKINLYKVDYQTVKDIYADWQWLGIFKFGTLLPTLIRTIFDRKYKSRFPYLLAALPRKVLSIK